MKNNLLILAAIFMIIGCSKTTKKQLGLTETMPDEYKVQRNKSLEVPPSYKANTSNAGVKNSKLSKAEQALLIKVK